MKELKNKTIVITGAAGTLGSYFSKILAKEGANVIATDINKAALEEISNQNLDLKIIPRYMDITDSASIDKVIKESLNFFGSIDTIINNAYPRNKNYGNKLENVSYQDFCENMNMHLGGYFLVSQRFSLQFKKQQKGNIINMSSIYGSIAPKFELYKNTNMTMPVEYAPIKAGVTHLTKYFAQYYKNIPIRVNSISPGGILADQPKPFVEAYNKFCGERGMLHEEDLAGLLIFLLSDESARVTGQNFIIDDGFSL